MISGKVRLLFLFYFRGFAIELVLEIFPSFATASADFRSRAIRKMVENSRPIRESRQISNYDREEKQVNLPFFRPQALVQSFCNAH